jgi:EAL domain-containing protein (putative c-di-GMP-specific phosphodiesterase class I)
MHNLQWSLSVLDQLRSFGVRIAVDDFGTGQSSLAYLKRFPLDTVKIDREFLRDLREPQDAAILASIVTLGHSLGLYVVAEGIETMAERDLLAAHGCDGLQGYLLGRPAPPAEIPRIVRSFSWAESESGAACEVIHRAS